MGSFLDAVYILRGRGVDIIFDCAADGNCIFFPSNTTCDCAFNVQRRRKNIHTKYFMLLLNMLIQSRLVFFILIPGSWFLTLDSRLLIRIK